MTTTVTALTALFDSQSIKFHSRKVELVDYTGVVTTFRRVNATTVEVNGEAFDTGGHTAIGFVRDICHAVAKASRTTQAAYTVEFARTADNAALNSVLRQTEGFVASHRQALEALDGTERHHDFHVQRADRTYARALTACEMLVGIMQDITGTEVMVPATAIFEHLLNG